MQLPSRLSGAAAARLILDRGGLQDIPIEEVRVNCSDHYDPTSRVVRLSSAVYHERSLAAVGIAAHEVGHALQHAHHYAPLFLRNIAVPAAAWGPTAGIILLIIGAMLHAPGLIWLGLGSTAVVLFQLVNLPVEFDASARAKQLLSTMSIVDADGAVVVKDVLSAAAWTYVAGTLQAVLTLAYYAMRFSGMLRSERE